MVTRGGNSYALIRHALCAYFDEKKHECADKHESGGILIGSYRGPHVEVVDRTTPGPSDESTLTTFTRQDPIHQAAAHRAWVQSDETLTFIGDWHSHPSGDPHPSSIDRRSWRGVAMGLKAPCVFIIVSPKDWAVFRVASPKEGVKCTKLRQIELGDTGIIFG